MRFKWLIIGGLALALLAVCGAIVGISFLTVSRLASGGLRFNAFNVETVSAEADEEQRFTVQTPAALELENVAGDVTITGEAGDEIIVAMHKTGWGATQAEAEAALAALKVTLTQNGDTITVRVDRPAEVDLGGSSRTDTVDFTIRVPARLAVTASTSYGDVTLGGTTGAVELHTDFGDVAVTDLNGELTATSSSGKVTARRVQAGDQTITLKSDFGEVVLEGARADDVDVRSTSGTLKLTDVTAAGKVVVNGDFGSLTLKQVAAKAYDLHSSSGAITVDGAAGTLKAASDFGNIEVNDATSVTLDLRTQNGSIDVNGSLGDGPHVLESSFGRVRLALPEETALDVDLQTDFGKITSAFPVTVSGDFSKTRLSGALNGGGASLRVRTNNGDITLEILTP